MSDDHSPDDDHGMLAVQTISASEFTAKCLEILQKLGDRGLERVVITKRGRPVAVLTPPDAEAAALGRIHGFMKGSIWIPDDFDLTVPVLDEAFDAEKDRLHG